MLKLAVENFPLSFCALIAGMNVHAYTFKLGILNPTEKRMEQISNQFSISFAIHLEEFPLRTCMPHPLSRCI